jgi:sulfur relay (sulfurtransferase) DsrC/TusE family protein
MNKQATITVVARSHLDEDGYLLPSEKWDANVGRLLAHNILRSELTEDHLKIEDNRVLKTLLSQIRHCAAYQKALP